MDGVFMQRAGVLRHHRQAVPVDPLVFRAGGDELIARNSRTVLFWDGPSGSPLPDKTITMPGWEEMPGYTEQAAFHPRGDLLAVVFNFHGPTVHIWDLSTGKRFGVPFVPDKHPQVMAFDPESDLLALGYGDGRVRMWNPRKGRAAGPFLIAGHSIWDMTFPPGGGPLISVGSSPAGPTARRWEVPTSNRKPTTLPLTGIPSKPISPHLPDSLYGGIIRACAFDPAATRFAAAISWPALRRHERLPHEVWVWDLFTGTACDPFALFDRVFEVAFHPQSGVLAVAGIPGPETVFGLVLWDPATGEYDYPEPGDRWPQGFRKATFHPGGSLLATESWLPKKPYEPTTYDDITLWDMTVDRS
ncbi:WD40 repeat domain-containing protein [Streptosporangium sp. NPDC002544]|uniref:WD40 repeat domain-containing protein n=1 Tax=Streptosporangium sp. NPDC002544 TaxID=3154538 RepID=UPI00332CF391